MNVISIENISKTLKDEPLFSNVTFGLEEGERLGVTGQNGCGKSTLLKIINGNISPDSGRISINNNCEIAMLPQTTIYAEESTIKSFFFESQSKRIKFYSSLIKGEIFDFPLEMDPWNAELDYESYLQKLDVKEDYSTPMKKLSGGTIKKVAIARLLATKSNILILDEPTNHLDILSIEWLESYLKGCGSTVILVTHDRYFLNSISTQIAEIDRQQLFMYTGNYSDYIEKREERINSLLKEQDRLKTILRRELEWLKQGPKARTSKDQGRKDRIEEMKNQQEQIIPDSSRNFSSIQRRIGKKILELKNINITRNGNCLLRNFDFSFLKGQRIGVIGPNGSGKSTLLDVIVGSMDPTMGERDAGINTHFGYYDQLSKNLPKEKTPIEYISEISEHIRIDDKTVVTSARFLELFGFPISFHRIPINILSGGEKRRLYLLACLASNPNFLILDEPTNDLDIETIRKLEEYILNFSGVVVSVSHDRAFLDRACEELFVLPGDGSLLRYPGTFSDFRTENQTGYGLEQNTETKNKKTNKPKTDKKRGPTFKEKKEFEELSEKIEELESRKNQLEEFFSTGNSTNLKEKQLEYNQIISSLTNNYELWEELSEKME